MTKKRTLRIRHSNFVIPSNFVIRHSSSQHLELTHQLKHFISIPDFLIR